MFSQARESALELEGAVILVTGGAKGLGLAIARQLAEAHGGSLVAANHPQGGAVFILTLPKTS